MISDTMQALVLQERLDDFMDGYVMWRDQKIATGKLTAQDEMLIRWVEHLGRHGEIERGTS